MVKELSYVIVWVSQIPFGWSTWSEFMLLFWQKVICDQMFENGSIYNTFLDFLNSRGHTDWLIGWKLCSCLLPCVLVKYGQRSCPLVWLWCQQTFGRALGILLLIGCELPLTWMNDMWSNTLIWIKLFKPRFKLSLIHYCWRHLSVN